MDKDDYAFPHDYQTRTDDEPGLTKREYIATSLYAGLLATCATTKQRIDSAEHAVELADELIKALNKDNK